MFRKISNRTLSPLFSRLVPVAVILMFIAALCFFIGRMERGHETISRSYYVMGGIVLEIRLHGPANIVEKGIRELYEQVEAVDKACDIYNPDSELSRLNSTAYNKPFVCSDLLWNILLKSKYYYELTDGAFDISATPLMKLWGFYRKRRTLPSEKEISEALKHVGLDKVIFDNDKKSIRFTVPGMRLDLGGIAKGYAVDLAAKFAKKHHIRTGLINLSGNAYCLPAPFPGRTKFRIGIRDPLHKNRICGIISLLGQGVATSGDYERYVVIDGRHYTHIMNPKTGQPVEDMLSVTVVAPSATDSDALSTSVFLKGAEFAEKIHRIHPEISILVIRRNRNNGKPETVEIGDIWDLSPLKRK